MEAIRLVSRQALKDRQMKIPNLQVAGSVAIEPVDGLAGYWPVVISSIVLDIFRNVKVKWDYKLTWNTRGVPSGCKRNSFYERVT